MATASQVRTTMLKVKEGVNALKAAVDAVATEVNAMTLTGVDGVLPDESQAKEALVAYRDITVPSLSNSADISAVMAVVIDPEA